MESVKNAICHRIVYSHGDLIAKHGIRKVMDEIEFEAVFVGEVDEIGTSDVSIWVNEVIRRLEGK